MTRRDWSRFVLRAMFSGVVFTVVMWAGSDGKYEHTYGWRYWFAVALYVVVTRPWVNGPTPIPVNPSAGFDP